MATSKHKGHENLELGKWQKGQSGNPKGRPKKSVNAINEQLKAEGFAPVSATEIREAQEIILNLPLAKVAAIANKGILYKNEDGEVVYLESGDEYPLFYRLVSKELLGKRGGEYLEKLLDRAHGKATQNTNHSVDLPTDTEINLIVKGSKSKLI